MVKLSFACLFINHQPHYIGVVVIDMGSLVENEVNTQTQTIVVFSL